MKIVALGRTHWLYESIQACAQAGHQIVCIGTCEASPEYTVREKDFKKLARSLNAEFFCDARLNQDKYVTLLRHLKADVAISMNWVSVIKEPVLRSFRLGVLNAHPGDLPRFRGNACPNWAILNGEKKMAVSLHQMAPELDAGPIVLKKYFPITPRTYIQDLYQNLTDAIPSLFVEGLAGLASGRLKPKPQPKNPKRALRCFPRVPDDGFLDWTQPAWALDRLVRASAEPFAGAFSFLDKKKLVVWRAHGEKMPTPSLGVPGQVVARRPASGEVSILTGKESLVLEEVQLAGQSRQKASDVIRSLRTRLGLRF